MKYSLSFIKVSNNELVQYNNKDLHSIYLDYFNNFLTIGQFAEYYKFTEYEARKVIELGGMVDEDIYQQTGE